MCIRDRVYRWCTASWLECQDMWRLGGIFRDVYVYTTERQYIRDYEVIAEPDVTLSDGYADILVKTNGSYESLSLDLNILDKDGNTVALDSQYANEDHQTDVYKRQILYYDCYCLCNGFLFGYYLCYILTLSEFLCSLL